MTPEEQEQLFEVLDRIQYKPEQIYVRQGDSNVTLLELPTLPALQFVCEWLRKHIIRLGPK